MLQRLIVVRLHIAMLVVLTAAGARAEWIPLAGGPVGEAPRVVVTAVDAATVEVAVTVPGLGRSSRVAADAVYDLITVPGCVPRLEAGAPALPVLARALRLPAEGSPELAIVRATWRALPGALPVPSRGPLSRAIDPASVPLVRGAVYASDAVWPAEAASLGRPFLVRDRRGVALHINPVRWHPATGELQALVAITLRVTVRGKGGVNTAGTATVGAPRSFAPVYRALFGSQPAPDQDKVAEDQGVGYGLSERMLVVTSASLRNSVSDFVDWKREYGYTVELLDMDAVGGTVLGLRTAVQDRFYSEEGLAHLVLVGDVEQVPTNLGGIQGADSDGTYGLLAGDDLFVDVLVSRLPARNAGEARLMLGRSIRYERDPQLQAAWYATAVGIASDEGDPADDERCDWLREDLLAGDYESVARIYQGFGGERAHIAAAVNAGASLVNYLGHGSGTGWLSVPFDIADVHQLRNTAAWPWIIDVSCDNGDFSEPECFAEAWLRSNHEGEPAGAVAMISSSTPSSWVPPCVMQATMVDELVAAGQLELGALFALGVAEVLVQYEGTNEGFKLMQQYNLFGDGSLQVRTRAPEVLAVTHADFMPVGITTLPVSLPAGARAVLTDGAVVLARAVAGADEEVALLPGRTLVEGETVRLTVTARNALPYRVELPVSAAPTAAVDSLPDAAALLGNWPNPFNPQTTVGFALPEADRVRLSVHDARGRLVRVLVDGQRDAGNHRVTWDGRDQAGRTVASGVYLARFESSRGADVRKLTLTR